MYNSSTVIWVLVAAFLVYFMQAGFALCEAGLTRAKNTGNILMKNMMDFSSAHRASGWSASASCLQVLARSSAALPPL